MAVFTPVNPCLRRYQTVMRQELTWTKAMLLADGYAVSDTHALFVLPESKSGGGASGRPAMSP